MEMAWRWYGDGVCGGGVRGSGAHLGDGIVILSEQSDDRMASLVHGDKAALRAVQARLLWQAHGCPIDGHVDVHVTDGAGIEARRHDRRLIHQVGEAGARPADATAHGKGRRAGWYSMRSTGIVRVQQGAWGRGALGRGRWAGAVGPGPLGRGRWDGAVGTGPLGRGRWDRGDEGGAPLGDVVEVNRLI